MSDIVVIEPKAGPVFGLPPGDPTFAGFQWFVANMMGVPPENMPDDSVLQACYDQAVNLAYIGLATIPSLSTGPTIYAFAVYNLAAAILVETAMDDPNSDYWKNLRDSLGLNSLAFGLLTSAHDQGTSESQMIPWQLQHMTLWDLQLAKSPWGRKYLMFAGQWGSLWGITY